MIFRLLQYIIALLSFTNMGGKLMKPANELYDVHHIENFKDMIKATVEKYPDNVAYKFKKKC